MRFPNTPPMWRTFNLFRRLGFTGDYNSEKDESKSLHQVSASPKSVGPPDPKELYKQNDNDLVVIPYLMSTPADIQLFNCIRYSREAIDANALRPSKRVDLFDVSRSNDGPVPDEYVREGAQYWMDAKIGFFKEQLVENFVKGKELLMNYDQFSTRQFMQTLHPELSRSFDRFMRKEYPDRPLEYERAYPPEVNLTCLFRVLHV